MYVTSCGQKFIYYYSPTYNKSSNNGHSAESYRVSWASLVFSGWKWKDLQCVEMEMCSGGQIVRQPNSIGLKRCGTFCVQNQNRSKFSRSNATYFILLRVLCQPAIRLYSRFVGRPFPREGNIRVMDRRLALCIVIRHFTNISVCKEETGVTLSE